MYLPRAHLLLGEQHFGWLIGEFFLLSGVAFLSLIGKYVLLEVMGGFINYRTLFMFITLKYYNRRCCFLPVWP